MKKKKILIVDCNLKIGGIQKALINLLHEIHDRYDITLLLLYKHGALLAQVPPDVRVLGSKSDFRYMGMAQADCRRKSDKIRRGFYVLVARIWGQATAVKLAAGTVRRDKNQLDENYDAVISYSHVAGERSFYGGSAEYVLRSKSAGERICYIHCDYQNSANASAYSDRVYARFDRIICVSDSTRKRFIEALPALKDRVFACENPINVNEIRRRAQEKAILHDAHGLKLMTVARLTREKGVERMIRVLADIPNLRAHYYVVGAGIEAEQIRGSVARFGLGAHVTLLGEQENPYPYMANADLLVVPSYHEAAPVVFQEAKALNIPVLTTRTTSAEEMIGDRFGVVVENDDEALRAALQALIEDPRAIHRLSEAMRRSDGQACSQTACECFEKIVLGWEWGK